MIVSPCQSSDSLPSKPTSTSDIMDWRRPTGEPGSAFRGIPKSRGGGRGSSSGGRGRGGGRVRGGNRSSQNTASDDVVIPPATPTLTTPIINEPTMPPSESVPSGRTSRQKSHRKMSAQTSEESLRTPTTPATRPSNRRRRSNQSTTKTSNTTSNPPVNKYLTVEPPNRKAFTGPPTPSAPGKDLPPPISDSPSFDIRTNIDALVERVRAVAMDRPHTPGSHIDWAGEDDDSLPDLDDWGLPSSQEKISAILEGTELASLPNSPTLKDEPNRPSAGTSKDVQKQDSSSADAELRPHKVEKVRSKRGTRSRANSRAQQIPPAIEIKDSPESPLSFRNHTLSPKSSAKSDSQQATAKLPLHPSLPPKPLNPVEVAHPRGQNTAPIATPMRNQIPARPVPRTDVSLKVEEVDTSFEETKAEEVNKSVQNSDLILVPVEDSPTSSAFNPAHGRAHTVGAFADVGKPYSVSSAIFPRQLPLSGRSSPGASPLKSVGSQHIRNHSSPPAGHGFTRAPQTSRPVLTGDALSKLARTLGSGGNMSPRRDLARVSATE